MKLQTWSLHPLAPHFHSCNENAILRYLLVSCIRLTALEHLWLHRDPLVQNINEWNTISQRLLRCRKGQHNVGKNPRHLVFCFWWNQPPDSLYFMWVSIVVLPSAVADVSCTPSYAEGESNRNNRLLPCTWSELNRDTHTNKLALKIFRQHNYWGMYRLLTG